jgi:hypothetical protein
LQLQNSRNAVSNGPNEQGCKRKVVTVTADRERRKASRRKGRGNKWIEISKEMAGKKEETGMKEFNK